MQITNCGRGVHKREIKGIERFKKDLPSQWYGFTNLDLVLGPGKSREVDFIIVADMRIFLVDIKDWFGSIESRNGNWFQNNIDRGSSPVAKVTDIARSIGIILADTLKKRPETKDGPFPKVEGLVVLTGQADRTGIEGHEKAKVLTADEFIKIVADAKKQRENFGNVHPQLVNRPLTDPFWKDRLARFFGAGANSSFRPGHRRFQRYVADDVVKFSHPNHVYREYDATEEGNQNSLGTLRLWDFAKCSDGRFQTEEGRLEIAGREQQVYSWLRDRDEELERNLLTPKLDEAERSVNYWEIYDRRRRMQRLSDFASTEAKSLTPPEKIELARQLLAATAGLHRQDAAHLDLGGHSIWIESPTTVKLSHLLAARYPDVKTLGEARFQFLSSAQLPEDVLGEDRGPKRRDVFLIGVAVHNLLFGMPPSGDPAEWNPAVDARHEFEILHDWFAEALEVDPARRFDNAVVALEAYNKATAIHPTPDEVIAGLDQFRGTVRSQRQLAALYQAEGDSILESDRLDVWRSTLSGSPIVVKLWKQAAWGDLRREGAPILAFLQRAAGLKADRPVGLPLVKDVLWLGDAFVVAQEWVDGITLSEMLSNPPEGMTSFANVLTLVGRLIDIVEALHGRGFSHGDIKPANIVIAPEGNPFLIDALDFSPAADGDRVTSAYAPETGNRLERDRYALTKIAEELFALVSVDASAATDIAKAIRDCKEKEPALSTLLPLREAIETASYKLTAPADVLLEALPEQVSISIVGAQTGPIDPDEGVFFLRLRSDPERRRLSLIVRGAFEEIELRLDDKGKIYSARRVSLDQRLITRVARHEFYKLTCRLVVSRSDINDWSDILPLLDEPVVRARIDEALGSPVTSKVAEDEDTELDVAEDQAEDALVEEISVAQRSSILEKIDVPTLWRALIDAENELTTEGVAQLDSFFDRRAGRHKVPLELESGVFDFSPNDTVGVQVQDRKGGWRRIGELDVRQSKPDRVVIDASETASPTRERLIEAGQRLRFVSHFEVMSLRRRTDAVDRILAGNGRSQDLLSVFDPRLDIGPTEIEHRIDDVAADYGLNQDQTEAFERIVKARPVGVLQGPPGTGKTRFIAALAHYAITKGLARNVLLASQSHEAVNTAAEAVLSLFRRTGGQPSMLRVAMDEGLVSSALRPYHTARVEQAYKDRFNASFGERMVVAGKALGLSDEVVRDVVALEMTVRPIAARMTEIVELTERDEQRTNGLIKTLRAHLDTMGLADVVLDLDSTDWSSLADDMAGKVLSRHSRSAGVTADRIQRLRAVAAIGRDFIGSISQAQRSFDTFLAGTRQIVVGTCVGLGRTSLGLTTTAFDLVIVDEAARCTASELLVPLQAARWVVLVGDQAQLEPQHKPEVVRLVSERTGIHKREIQRSDFERVFSTTYGKSASATLKTQYRMWPPIGQLVSETFYPNLRLLPGRTLPEIDPSLLPDSLDKPLVWIETDGMGIAAYERKEDNSSRINRAEADGIIALLEQWHSHDPFREWLQTQDKHPFGIGIICMYAAQRDLIDRRLRQSSLGYLLDRHVKVGTVDSYQGKENPIVVLSLVRNNDFGLVEGGIKRIQEGFLSAPNRINVAASRAMDRLVIVGARKRWRSEGPVGRLAEGFKRQIEAQSASVIEIETLLDRDRQAANDREVAPHKEAVVAGGAHGNA